MSFAFTPMPHDEAVKRIESLPIVSREVMEGLLPELRAHAFTVSGLTKASQLARVKKILESVPAGANWDEAKKQVVGELATAGITGKEAQRRAETLLRTTAFRAYAATRYQTLMRQTDVFPFWQYKTAGDGRVRPAHTALHNRIFPAGHPVWQRIFPPWGWGCRCLVVPLTKRTAERMGVQGEELRAKGQESLPADGGLLKGQRQAPILYTPKEADLIAQSARLPGGISIEVEPSWGRAPWSEKGNLRPSWAYLEELYKDDAEAFAAFREWAGKTEVSKDLTVADWLHGKNGIDKPSDGFNAAAFTQPNNAPMITAQTELKPKKNGTKEEKKLYYKMQQQKINAKTEAAAAKDRYDGASNKAGIPTAALETKVTIEVNTLGGSFPSTSTLEELLAEDGQPSLRFWQQWRGEDDGYGLMRGPMSFKSQFAEAGFGVKKLPDGRWSLTVNGTPILPEK